MRTMAFVSAAGFAAACGSSGSSKSSGSSGSTTPPTFDPKPEAKTLNFYNWTDYIADDTIPNFQKETGIKVTYDNYSSNDELFNKLSAGSTGYDIIVPTDAILVKMKHADLLEPLDLTLIPNVKNLDARFTHRRVRPRQPVLDPVAVGHHRHRLRQDEGRRRRHRLGRAQAPGGEGQVVVPRRGARRVRDGAVRPEEGSRTPRTTTTSTRPGTT